MKTLNQIEFSDSGNRFVVDMRAGRSIAIDLDFNGAQPNHFGVSRATSQPLVAGGFVGDTRQGGSCNVNSLQLIPHCNGTHTETVGHIVNDIIPICEIAPMHLLTATLITVLPVSAKSIDERYGPELEPTDLVVSASSLEAAHSNWLARDSQAIIVRTLPNAEDKRARVYGDNCQPSFLTFEAMEWLNRQNVQHLLIDLPSVDRMYDGGKLYNHHRFWNVEPGSRRVTAKTWRDKTITEMVFVPDDIADGEYLLSLQIAPFVSDAAPSRPIIFPMQRI